MEGYYKEGTKLITLNITKFYLLKLKGHFKDYSKSQNYRILKEHFFLLNFC
jgi:hypothetical protein